MSETSENDRVEILDNGVHLGWADVEAGKWSLPLVNLPLGSRGLTARYKNKESQRWEISVKVPARFDDFNGAPLGPHEFLRRPFFLSTYEAQGQVTSSSPMNIYRFAIGNSPSTRLEFTAVADPRPNMSNYDLLGFLTFHEVCSAVSLSIWIAYGTSAERMMIVASDEAGVALDSVDLNELWSGRPQIVTLQGRPEQMIRRLKFCIFPKRIGQTYSEAHVAIDDILMQS